MVDITKKPFNLSEKQCEWVYSVLDSMTIEEKIGQTFCVIGLADTDEELFEEYKKVPFGGVMYRPGNSTELRKRNEFMQKKVKIPLLIAANLESGGVGLASDGTLYGSQMQVAATGNKHNAYIMGDICGSEAKAIGANLAFAPIVDIDKNWRNPITNTRTFGSDPERVLDFASEYLKGIMPHRIAVSIKHFPGDGVDERDQHIVASVNTLSCKDWDATYGKIYKSLIDQGAQTVMAGHILQPAYSRYFNPDIKNEEIMPASISPELISGLLRSKLEFNGVVITDATNMVGICSSKARKDIPASVINAGCDMFLFGRNVYEDYQFMLDAAEKGIISQERLDEAAVRILALKASLGLSQMEEIIDDKCKSVIGCKQFHNDAEKCADESVTLVKDTQHLLPLTPEKHKRVWLYILGDENPTFTGGSQCKDLVISELEKAGFDVTFFDSEKATLKDSQIPVGELQKNYDVIMYFANIRNASYKTVNRISWSSLVGIDAPYFVKDIPTMFISLSNPYHFVDVPMIKTIINGYTVSPEVIHAVVEKITGKSEFKGISPVDPFCGMWGADI